VDHSKAKAAIGGARDGLDRAILDADGLVLALDRARVGVRCASRRRDLNEMGQCRRGDGHGAH